MTIPGFDEVACATCAVQLGGGKVEVSSVVQAMEWAVREAQRQAIPRGVECWTWRQAPDAFRALSQHGGDEEGVAFVPTGIDEPWWLDRCWDMYGEPDRYEHPLGTVIIWSH